VSLDRDRLARLQAGLGSGVIPLAGVGQLGFLVDDLERGMLRASALWRPEGPWSCWTHGPASVPSLSYRGEPGRFSMRIAMAGAGPQIELIQPLEGPSIFHEWIDEHGYGLHHLAFDVTSMGEAVAVMAAAGYPVIQSGAGHGLDGDGAFAYFDTVADFGIVAEARCPPLRRAEPDLVWPSDLASAAP
jgi:hypothetical protein